MRPAFAHSRELERLVEALWKQPAGRRAAGFAVYDCAAAREHVAREIGASVTHVRKLIVTIPDGDGLSEALTATAGAPAIVCVMRTLASSERFGARCPWNQLETLFVQGRVPPHVYLLWVTPDQLQAAKQAAPTLAQQSIGRFDFRLTSYAAAADLRARWLLSDSLMGSGDLAGLRRVYATLLDECQADREGEPELLGYAHLRLAQVLLREYRDRDAREHLRLASYCARDGGSRGLRGRVLLTRGVAAIRHGDIARAQREYERSLTLFVADEDLYQQAMLHKRLGELASLRGQAEASQAHLAQALQLAEAEGQPGLSAAVHRALGDACAAQGEARRALEHYEAALFVLVAQRDHVGQLGVYRGAAVAHLRLGEVEPAYDYARRALNLANTVGDPVEVAHAQHLLGTVHLARRDVDSAEVALYHALEQYERVAHRYGMAQSHMALGEVFLVLRGDHEAGLRQLEAAAALYQALGLGETEAQVRLRMAHALEAAGVRERAQACREAALRAQAGHAGT